MSLQKDLCYAALFANNEMPVLLFVAHSLQNFPVFFLYFLFFLLSFHIHSTNYVYIFIELSNWREIFVSNAFHAYFHDYLYSRFTDR